jgi:hypothetical protein
MHDTDMARLQVNKLLETVIQQQAKELHLAPGEPPFLVLWGRPVQLPTKTLDADDIRHLLEQIAPVAVYEQIALLGSGEFEFDFGRCYRFQAVVRSRAQELRVRIKLIARSATA